MQTLETTKLENELSELKRAFWTVKNKNTVSCNAPKLKRTYTYKKSGQL